MKTGALLTAVLASLAFGTSGAFIKPLLEAGWSPAAAVMVRTLAAGVSLTPIALVALRGAWRTLWLGRWRILGMAVVGVAAAQLAYFAAVERIPVGSAVLIEYLAPVLLVVFVWARTRRAPGVAVIVGSLLAMGGLVLVVGPGKLGSLDALGVAFAFLSAVGAAGYFLIVARPDHGLPAVALAWAGLLIGSACLFLLGAFGSLPLRFAFTEVRLVETDVPWWVPLLVVALVGTALGYVASIAATTRLGSRLMSFVALLEVVFATLFAWLLLGESLTPVQLLGGALILVGIVCIQRVGAEPTAGQIPAVGSALSDRRRGDRTTGATARPADRGLEL